MRSLSRVYSPHACLPLLSAALHAAKMAKRCCFLSSWSWAMIVCTHISLHISLQNGSTHTYTTDAFMHINVSDEHVLSNGDMEWMNSIFLPFLILCMISVRVASLSSLS